MTERPRARAISFVALLGKAAAWIGMTAFVAVLFVVPGPMISTAAEVGPGIAFAEVDGRDVAIVSYADHGYGGLSFFLPWQHDGRVIAIDLANGETVWDRGIADTVGALTVLAAGEKYVYLLESTELSVIDLEDGSVIARAADISGLENFEVFQAEIIHSPQRGAIMLRPEDVYLLESTELSVIDLEDGSVIAREQTCQGPRELRGVKEKIHSPQRGAIIGPNVLEIVVSTRW